MWPSLEDPRNPLLGPTLWGLRRWGVWQTRGRSRAAYNALHLLAVLFVLSQYAELLRIRADLDLAVRNLSVTMLSTVCVVKAGSFVGRQREWRRLVRFVAATERAQLGRGDAAAARLVPAYTRYSRRVTYFYWALVAATVFAVVLAPFAGYAASARGRASGENGTLPYPEILSSWTPFDKSQGPGYWALVIVHSLICCYGGGIVASYDSNAVVLMSFFAGQLELIKLNCSELFGDGEEHISHRVAADRIRECHRHHRLLVEHCQVLKALLSPVLFVYVVICSLMLCASAAQLTSERTGSVQRVWIAEYLAALVAQLFLYCWHSNRVLLTSASVSEGVYCSAWWSRGVRERRAALLLRGQLARRLVFAAGPFTDLTVATFITIVRGAYSYYALLSQRDEQ